MLEAPRNALAMSCSAVHDAGPTLTPTEGIGPSVEWDIQPGSRHTACRPVSALREVFAAKIAIWGVTSPPPQVGRAAVIRAKVLSDSHY
jgi:hypothetical protein